MVTLPLGLGVATPGLTVVGFLVLARGWLLDRRRAERLSAMLDRGDVQTRELAATLTDLDHQVQAVRAEHELAVAELADA